MGGSAALITAAVAAAGLLAAGLPAARLNRVEPGVVMTRGEFD
jgi:hypothetical protein